MGKFAVFQVGFVAAVLLGGNAFADPYGLYYTATGQAQLAPRTILGQRQQYSVSAPSIVQQTNATFGIPDINLHLGPAALPGGGVVELFGGASAGGQIENGRLHGGIRAYAPDLIVQDGSTSTAFSTSSAQLRELWLDTMHVNGIAQSTVQILVTLHFSGLILVEGVNAPNPNQNDNIAALANLQLSSSSGVSCVQFCVGGGFNHTYLERDGSFNVEETFLINVLAGADVSIESQLGLDAITVGDIYGIASASVNAMDTSSIFFSVLTPGASLEFASGLTYIRAPNGIPEPGTLYLLVMCALVSALFVRRKTVQTRVG